MAKHSKDPREESQKARNDAAQQRAQQAKRNIDSVSAKTRGMQQKAQARRQGNR
ncbi:hypothetical protein G3I40_40125 [Streptomyces sp. SID14478]|uniref:hypothetical protein n=1 Tax=Streptomyces sp. SID14478 TaxID=2706073 RepID=UPI0013E0E556|nr:hypothetical protein [Streptomyces sp. SID14478]NEB81375.1 hypothetical protein [Streptomyces sp. SID14478]